MFGEDDDTLRPDLAEQRIKNAERQALTNRLGALMDFLNARPIVPFRRDDFSRPDSRCLETYHAAFAAAMVAVGTIAADTVKWTQEARG